MAYIELATITDIHALRVIDEDPTLVERCQVKTDRAIRKVALTVGVVPEDIPIDANDHTTSDTLMTYGQYQFLLMLFEGVWGGVKSDDIYSKKIEYYTKRASLEEKKVTKETILGNTETRINHRRKAKPIW